MLLFASAIVCGATFAVWAAFPSYPAFALGLVLWGISGAIASGAYDAYVYDQLAAHDQLRSYPRIIARGGAGVSAARGPRRAAGLRRDAAQWSGRGVPIP